MDIQVILIFILAILTVSLVVVGFYVVLVLKEFRNTVRKTNSVLDNVRTVTNTVSNPISAITSLVTGIAQGFKTVKSITTLTDEDEDMKGAIDVRRKK